MRDTAHTQKSTAAVMPSDATVKLLEPGNYRRICRGAGVTPQHIARVVTGRKGASLHVAKRIADAAGVTLDELYLFIMTSPTLNIKGRPTMVEVYGHKDVNKLDYEVVKHKKRQTKARANRRIKPTPAPAAAAAEPATATAAAGIRRLRTSGILSKDSAALL